MFLSKTALNSGLLDYIIIALVTHQTTISIGQINYYPRFPLVSIIINPNCYKNDLENLMVILIVVNMERLQNLSTALKSEAIKSG